MARENITEMWHFEKLKSNLVVSENIVFTGEHIKIII